MKRIKIDVVVLPLSGHLFPALNLLAPLLKNPLYDIRLFTGPQRKAVAEEMGFQVLPILENFVDEGHGCVPVSYTHLTLPTKA